MSLNITLFNTYHIDHHICNTIAMACEEHKLLANYIKDVHLSLRKSCVEQGAETAWLNHCMNGDKLAKYAKCMEKLATVHWESNCNRANSETTSRIKWVADFCYDYYINKNYSKFSLKEITIAEKLGVEINTKESFNIPLKLLDVGSCYNPFTRYSFFDVFAVDLCPANISVLKCDFLNVNISLHNIVEESNVIELGKSTFDIVTFCFLLEYIPSSELRIAACKNAYELLKPGGLLIITTPDSKHVGANSRIIKCWRYTLALIGFSRIKYEKSKYMHCMAFRKSLNKEVAFRWAKLYKESYMQYAIQIPQDYNNYQEEVLPPSMEDSVIIDFQELPFCETVETL